MTRAFEDYEVLADGRSFVRSDLSVAGVAGPIHSRIFTGTRRTEKKQAHLRAWHALA
jgi:hypothetical protein